MSEQTRLTLTVDADLRDDFLAEAETAHREAGDLIQELMRDFVERQKEARAYNDFLRRKVEKARASAAAGRLRSNEDVEAEFAARRKALGGA